MSDDEPQTVTIDGEEYAIGDIVTVRIEGEVEESNNNVLFESIALGTDGRFIFMNRYKDKFEYSPPHGYIKFSGEITEISGGLLRGSKRFVYVNCDWETSNNGLPIQHGTDHSEFEKTPDVEVYNPWNQNDETQS